MKRYYELFSPVKEFICLGEKEPWQIQQCSEILNILNVKYLNSSFTLKNEDFTLIRSGKVKLYENLRALPRAYSVQDVTVVKDDAEALTILGTGGFDARRSMLITRGEYDKVSNNINKVKGLSPDKYKGETKILKYSLNNVEIETSGNDSSFLVLADNFYPGWKVYVNDSEKTIVRVNHNLRGVVIPQGKNRVTFRYSPLSFKIGALVTLLTLLGIIIFVGTQKRRDNTQGIRC